MVPDPASALWHRSRASTVELNPYVYTERYQGRDKRAIPMPPQSPSGSCDEDEGLMDMDTGVDVDENCAAVDKAEV